MDRRNFIINKIPFFKFKPRLLSYLKCLVPQFVNKGDLIYKEGTAGNYIYMVYRGEVNLYKTIKSETVNIQKRQTRSFVKSDVATCEKNILKMSKGGVAGLEILTEGVVYRNTLRVAF